MNAEAFFESFDLLAEAPNGVAKLRELILQLAIQGKLIAQDAADESVESLLASMGAAISVNNDSKRPHAFSIPTNWTWIRLNVLVESMSNGIYKPSTSYCDSGVGCLRMYNIQDGRLVLNNLKRMKLLANEVKQYELLPNDLLVNRVNSRELVGKAGIVEKYGEPLIFESKNIRIRFKERTYLPRYINLLFRTSYVRDVFSGDAKQTCGQASINQPQVADLLVPLPPLAEQRRIVSKVDELLGLCDELETRQGARRELRERLVQAALDQLLASQAPADFATHWQRLQTHFDTLFDTIEAVECLRLAILQLAITGKLAPRDSQDKSVEQAVNEARQFEGLDEVDWKEQARVRLPFDVPQSWRSVTVDDVAFSRLGKMLDQEKNKGTPRPYLRNTNVHWLRFQLEDIKYMPLEDDEIDAFEVKPGDLLICEGGHGIARTAVWEGEIKPMMFQKALHRVRPFSCLNSYFLAFCLRVYESTGILSRYYTGAGIPHFTGKSLAKVIFPLPPRLEQDRIVAKAKELLDICDALAKSLAASAIQSEKVFSVAVGDMLVTERQPLNSTKIMEVPKSRACESQRTAVASRYSS